MGSEAVQITGRLLDMRETVRRLHRERYHEVIGPWCDVVRKVADERDIPILRAGTLMADAATKKYDGMAALIILAATVECIEPTPAEAEALRAIGLDVDTGKDGGG